jgi:hypothetical protein
MLHNLHLREVQVLSSIVTPTLKSQTHHTPTAGSITFMQFFGSSLAPNPHSHMMFLDGVFARGKDGIKFFEHQGFCQESMFDVVEMTHLRLSKLIASRVYDDASGETRPPEEDKWKTSSPYL